MLAEVGIDLDDVTRQLQIDGVDSFTEFVPEAARRSRSQARRAAKPASSSSRRLALGVHAEQVQATIKDLAAHHVNVRIWEHDGTVWKDHPQIVAKIKNRLGWLDVTKTIDLERLIALQNRKFDPKPTHVVLLGMGGSSLAPEVMFRTFGAGAGFPTLLMLDSTDPRQHQARRRRHRPRQNDLHRLQQIRRHD